MGVYCITVASVLIPLLFTRRERSRRTCLLISCIWMILVIGLRAYTIGTDTYTYYITYKSSYYQSLENYFTAKGLVNILYDYVRRMFLMFSFPFQNMLIFEGIVIMIPIYIFATRYSAIPWLSVLIYIGMGYFNQSMNISRQYISIGIVLIAILFAFNSRVKQFVLLVLLASLFHISALMVLVLYPVINSNKRILNKIMIGLIPFGFIIPLFLSSNLSKYLPLEYYRASGNGGMTSVIIWIILLLYLLFVNKQKNNNIQSDERNHQIKNTGCTCSIIDIEIRLISLSIFFQSFITKFVVIGRIAYYFIIPFYVLLPNVLFEIISERSKIAAKVVVATLVLLFYFVLYLPSGASQTVPYSFGSFQ